MIYDRKWESLHRSYLLKPKNVNYGDEHKQYDKHGKCFMKTDKMVSCDIKIGSRNNVSTLYQNHRVVFVYVHNYKKCFVSGGSNT